MAALTTQADWEDFDAASLFDETPRLHANKVTYTDDPVGLVAESSDPETGHEDEVTVGQGDPSMEADERELQADKEEGTPPPVEQMPDEMSASDDSPAEAPFEAGEGAESSEAEGQPEADASDSAGSDGEAAPPESEPQGEDGAEAPIQKESEGVEEVAEATSKTSEDVHGGDEATKDIEDSPNAANDGQNPDNHRAEAGEGSEPDGESSEASAEDGEPSDMGEGQSPDSEKTDPQDASPEGSQAEQETAQDAAVSGEEDWEAAADQSAFGQRLQEQLAEVAAVRPASAAGGGASVDYSGESWDSDRLRVVFHKTRELIQKLVSEEDMTRHEAGTTRWWARELARNAVTYRHPRIPSAKFDRPKENNIVFFMDVSGSVSSLAELFMAIMGGAAGLPGVRIVVGSEAHAENEIVVDKPFKSVDKAIEFFRHTVNAHVCDDPYCTSCKGNIRNVGWTRPYDQPFEPGVVEFLRAQNLYNSTTTCVFFGDMQAVNFETRALRKLVRDANCLWLFTDEPGHYTHTGDLPRAVEAGLPIVYNVRDAQTFARAVRRLQ